MDNGSWLTCCSEKGMKMFLILNRNNFNKYSVFFQAIYLCIISVESKKCLIILGRWWKRSFSQRQIAQRYTVHFSGKAMQKNVVWMQPMLMLKALLWWQPFITTHSQYVVICTETNIPIPYLVYVSPTPGRKSRQSIKE